MSTQWQYDWYVLAVIGLLFVCSLITRSGYWLIGDHLPLPDSVRRALRYAPVAALIAIIVPELLPWRAGGSPEIDLKAIAAIFAVLAYLRTRSTLVVIIAGMVMFWLLKYFFA
jgi:branched-subunit amino acid transport protein